jgi:hypothetical protein
MSGYTWWKLAGLAFLEAVLVWWLTRPIPTHAVLIDPTKALPARMPVFPLSMQIEVYAAELAVIVIPIIAYWLFRRSARN